MCESGYGSGAPRRLEPGLPCRRRGNPDDGRYSRGFLRTPADFALHIRPAGFCGLCPLLCAGITTYSRRKRYSVGPGSRVAILGLGGLGHVGVQIAKAMGADMSVISRSLKGSRRPPLQCWLHFYATSEEGVLESLREFLRPDPVHRVCRRLDYANYMAAPASLRRLRRVGFATEPSHCHALSRERRQVFSLAPQIGGIAETQSAGLLCRARRHPRRSK